jgi:hypothetical protein
MPPEPARPEPKELVTLATFQTPEEAYLVKNVLEEEGVRAYLSDEATVGLNWALNNALGGIKLQVAAGDVERARQVFRDRPAEGPVPVADEPEAGDRSAQEPWLAGASVEEPEGDSAEEDEEPPTPSGDEQAARALRAATIGLLICPPLLHVYSLVLLIQLSLSGAQLSPSGKRRRLAAFLIDAGLCSLIALAVLAWFSQVPRGR